MPEFVWDLTGHAYFFSALMVLSVGGGIALYERFTPASRRFLVLAAITASWMTALGLAGLATTRGDADFWLRVAFAADPFTAPAMYWLSAGLAGVPRRRLTAALFAIGAAFATTNLAGPWLVTGLEQATRGLTLTGFGWLGLLYSLFILTGVGLGVRELWRAGIVGAAPQLRFESRFLAIVGMLASLTLLDYWLPNEPYRVGVLTPFAIGTGALLAAVVSSRYRAFSVLHAFGTEEVLRALSDAVLVCDREGRIRAANDAAERLLGRTERRLAGMKVGAVIGGREGTPSWEPDADEAVRGRRLFLLSPDAPAVPAGVSTEPMVRGGRVVGFIIIARDLREQVRTQGALEEAERRFRALFEYNPGIVYEIAPDGSMMSLNPAGEEILGESAATLGGRSFVELITPEDRPRALEVFEQVLSGAPGEYELGIRRRDHGRRRIRGMSVPVQEGGEVVSVLGVAMDVTEESRAKQGLEVQRRYYAELFEASPEAVVLVGADGRVRRVNGEFGRLFGYSREEAAGRLLDDLIVPEDRREEGAELTRMAITGGVARSETVRRRKEGGLVEVSLLAREVRIPGEPPQMYAIYRDATERRAAERRLRDREEELRHAQKLEAVGKLAGGIAHDFNNLLTVINGHARFLLDNAGPTEQLRGDLEEIERAGARAATLTQQLLAFSRRQVLRLQVLDLNTVINDFQSMLARLIGEHIRLETHLDAPDARVHADRGQLEQVVMNLVVNARDAMSEGGTISLGTRVIHLGTNHPDLERWDVTPGAYVRLDVTDDGHGIDPDTLERVFEPFFTTKERGKGTGLGLATVFGIVKQTGGHITAESVPGGGSTFCVLLPLAARAGDEPAPAAEPARQNGAASARTILVVEDETAVRKLAVRVLERAGHTVLQAGNGLEALALLDRSERDVHLVLTDLVMPEMGGRDLRNAVARRRPGLPVVFMSGYDEEQALVGSDGEDGFLPKPFTPAALVEIVARALEGSSRRD